MPFRSLLWLLSRWETFEHLSFLCSARRLFFFFFCPYLRLCSSCLSFEGAQPFCLFWVSLSLCIVIYSWSSTTFLCTSPVFKCLPKWLSWSSAIVPGDSVRSLFLLRKPGSLWKFHEEHVRSWLYLAWTSHGLLCVNLTRIDLALEAPAPKRLQVLWLRPRIAV